MAKSTKIIAALGVVAGLGVAAMPLASYALEDNASDVRNLVDDINVTVQRTCTFNSETKKEGTEVYGKVFNATAIAGAMATFTNPTHTFSVTCNDDAGYSVEAVASGLAIGESTETNRKIAYTADDITGIPADADAKKTGKWTAQVASTDTETFENITAVPSGTAAAIINTKTGVGSTGSTAHSFSVTYKAYVGTENEAGTYTGTVTYRLVPGTD